MDPSTIGLLVVALLGALGGGLVTAVFRRGAPPASTPVRPPPPPPIPEALEDHLTARAQTEQQVRENAAATEDPFGAIAELGRHDQRWRRAYRSREDS